MSHMENIGLIFLMGNSNLIMKREINMIDVITEIIKKRRSDKWWVESEQKVIGRYGKLFNPINLKYLSKEEFNSFLLIKNNFHWEGIHRQNSLLTSDMGKLIKGLLILLDESKILKDRLELLFPKGKEPFIKGLGKAVLTPILLVVYPDKYGVWNQKSEAALKKLNLFPEFHRGDSFSNKYIRINQALLDLKETYSISLWQLDGVLGEIAGKLIQEEEDEDTGIVQEAKEQGIDDIYNFGMESHLEDFLINNWGKTFLGKKYNLIYKDDELKSKQYLAKGIGNIDILAVEKGTGNYLVIELKKGRTSDAVVGQILRYKTWVERNLAGDKKVEGLVIAPEVDLKLELSIAGARDVKLCTYRIDFDLVKYEIKH